MKSLLDHQMIWFIMIKVNMLLASMRLVVMPSPTYPTTIPANNQVVKLIIKSYVQEILSNPLIPEHELKDKLSKMSQYIATHPALHQRYLWVGSTPPPPNYNPDHHILEYERPIARFDNETIDILPPILKVKRKKNSEKREQLPSEEICETKEKWEQIVDTHDLFDNKVKVIQEKDMQQFVFTYRCAKNKGKCLGISPLYESECTERFGWMYMYYKPVNGDKQPQWGFVNAPHHCACKLKPKLFVKDDQMSPNDI